MDPRLQAQMANEFQALRIPLSMGTARTETDKSES